jgi:hypothetical protein
MASFSVQFADGTSHTYDNVPAGVTQEQVNVRARTDYPDKEIQEVTAGVAAEAPKLPEPTTPPTAGETALGIAQTAGQLASEYGLPAAEIGGGLLGAKKAFEAINAYKGNTAVTQMNGLLNAYSKVNNDIRQYEKMGGGTGKAPAELYQMRDRLTPQVQAAQAKVPGFSSATPTAPATPTAQGPVKPTTFTGGVNPAFDQALSKAPESSRFAQLAQRFAPILNNPVMRMAGKVAGPVAVADMLTHSGGLNEGEDQMIRKIHAQQDQERLNQAIRMKAAQKALGQ